MSTVEEIKVAAAALDPDQQVELFRWWVQTDTFKQRQLAALRLEIAKGVEDLAAGRYKTYSDENLMQLAEEIGKSGRERLKKAGKKKE